MAEKNPMQEDPFSDIFQQIGEILQFVRENASKPANIPASIADKLSKLRTDVEKFKQKSDKFVQDWDETKKALKEKIRLPFEEISMTKEDRRRQEQVKQLKAKLEAASKVYEKEAADAYMEGAKMPSKTEVKSGKKRRGKFRRFGGSKGWKPL